MAFLVWAFWDVDFEGFRSAFASARYSYFVLALFFSIAQYLIRAYRWKYLLFLQKDIPYYSVLSALFIGFFANSVLPFRAGEFLRAYVIGRNENISKSSVLATVLVERTIDVLSLLFIAVVALLFFPIPEGPHFDMIKYFGVLLFTVEIGVIAFCFLLLIKRDLTLKYVEKVLALFPGSLHEKGIKIVQSFLDGLEILRSTRNFIKIIVPTIGVWIIAIMQFYAVLEAFDLQYGISMLFIIAIVDSVLVSFALTIPSAPGFIGTFHAAAKEGLVIFSIGPAIASGFAVLIHATAFLPAIVAGFYFFLRENIKLSKA